MVILLLLACGIIGAAYGWSLGSYSVGHPTHDSFDPPGPKRSRIVLTTLFALAFVASALLLLVMFDR